MSEEVKIPLRITNEDLWRNHCREICTRSMDFLEGRLGVIETARAMLPLTHWTGVENDPEFLLFRAIASETDDLPVGDVRAYWTPDALEREDVRIKMAETQWNEKARGAASKLVVRYNWTVRQKRISGGE